MRNTHRRSREKTSGSCRQFVAAAPNRRSLVQPPGGVSKGEGSQTRPFVLRGGMGDGGLHRHGITIPGPVGPPIVPFPRKRAASSATGGAWPAFPHVSGGGLRGRYLCAKDTFPLPWHGNVPLREQRDFSPRKKFFPHRYVRFRATFPRVAAIFERTASRKHLPRPPQGAVIPFPHQRRKEYPMDFQEIFSLPGGGRP